MAHKDPVRRRAYNLAYRDAHREERKAYDRSYYVVHREEYQAKSRAWRKSHCEECSAYNRTYYVAHQEDIRARAKAWYAKHQDKCLKFHGRPVYLPVNPRVGVCADCKRPRKTNERQFDLHHERYDATHPQAYTWELCPRCHQGRHALKKVVARAA